jgi:hypothetical protein
MAVKIKVQKDYLLTEASIELPAQVSQIDEILKASKSNGKMIVLYNEGCVQGINIEQRSKLSEPQSAKVREILKIDDVDL